MQPMRGFRKKRHEVIGQTQQMQNVVTAVGTAGRELVGVKRILRNQQPHPRRKPQLPMCQPDDKFPALDEQQQIIRDFPEGNMPRGKAVPVGDIEHQWRRRILNDLHPGNLVGGKKILLPVFPLISVNTVHQATSAVSKNTINNLFLLLSLLY